MKPFVVFYFAFIFFFCFIYFIISLFSVLVALGLCCLKKAYFSRRERAGAPLHHVHGLLLVVASLVAHGL